MSNEMLDTLLSSMLGPQIYPLVKKLLEPNNLVLIQAALSLFKEDPPVENWEFSTSSQHPNDVGDLYKMPPHLKFNSIKQISKLAPEHKVPTSKIFHHDTEMFRDIERLVLRFKANSSVGVMDYRDPKKKMKHYWRFNHDDLKDQAGVGKQKNIGEHADWYSDAIFGQQFFTGPNPTSIKLATKDTGADWLGKFQKAAKAQENSEVLKVLSDSSNEFYVADYSHFRTHLGLNDDQDICVGDKDHKRYGCASVALFSLVIDKVTGKGKLHPLAIILDCKSTIEKSVVIFNQRLSPEASTDTEKTDWPWRYAKTCVMVSDWAHHEIVVHLLNTHLVEEVAIVAAHKAFTKSNPILHLLQPHWNKTLALNLAARQTLVPAVIVPISPFSEKDVYAFITKAYSEFNWSENTIPEDLKARGFSDEEDWESKKFCNYAYARNMRKLWPTLKKFVTNYLESFPQFSTDELIKQDPEIREWVNQMRHPMSGNLPTFPIIEKKEQLIDALVMCIHIASPQHTAINYLQNYYQSFVPAKPPALYQKLPQSNEELRGFGEDNLVQSLPILGGSHYRLASYLSYLLSLRDETDGSLITYAETLASTQEAEQGVRDAASTFASDLKNLSKTFREYSKDLDSIAPHTGEAGHAYTVLDPENTPASILI